MRRVFIACLLTQLIGCDVTRVRTDLVMGSQQVCLSTTRAPLPQPDEDLRLWTFAAQVISVHASPAAGPCADGSTVVVDLRTPLGNKLSVGWRAQVEGVDVTPELPIQPGDQLIVRYGDLVVDSTIEEHPAPVGEGPGSSTRRAHALVMLRRTGELVLALEDGEGLSIDDLPGGSPIEVTVGDLQHGVGWTSCGRSVNVAMRVSADRVVQIKAGRRAELELDGHPLTAVNVGALAGRDEACGDHLPWYIVQGHEAQRRRRR